MVSFRLSAEEYERMREAESLHGVRSLSELARVAMNRMLCAPPEQVGLPEQVQDLRVRMETLSSEVKRLSRSVPEFAVERSSE